MEPQNPPSKIARLAHHQHATTRTRNENVGLEMKNKGPINSRGERSAPAGLGLGPVHGPGISKSSSGFTFLQRRELEHQALIYKYIEAGVVVPYHLILPVWNSVTGSFRRLNGGLHQHYNPNFLGYSALYNEYKDSEEAEPRRCRRTDGKKWRCSKDAVPNEKYCERHIHRGRHRSRKHVEAPAPPPPQLPTTTTTTTTTTTSNTTITSRDVHISSTNLSIVPPPTFQH